MSSIIKVLDTAETGLTSNSTVNGASLCRLFNNTAGQILVTRWQANTFYANGSPVFGTFTVGPNTAVFAAKSPTDFFEANASILCVPVAFQS